MSKTQVTPNGVLEGMVRHDMAFAQGMISAAQQLGYFVRDEEGCRALNRIYERASDMRLEGRKALRAAAGGWEMSEWAKEDLAHSVRNVVHLLRAEANLVGFFGQNRAQVKCGAVADYLAGALAEYEKRVSPTPPEVK